MVVTVKIAEHAQCAQVVQWLHDHVGARVDAREQLDGLSVHGSGWCYRTVANWLDYNQWHMSGRVDFEDHVSPDVITQFMLTWS